MTATNVKFEKIRLGSMTASAGFVPSMNGLRAISILIVFFSHTISNKLFPGGFGVRVFFVISGFLIARLLFLEWKKESTIYLKDFYIRRFLRLYPVVIIYTFAVLLAYQVLQPSKLNWGEPLSALFYYANYYYSALYLHDPKASHLPLEIFWSLSVEEHFYLLFPVAFVLARANPRIVALICASVAVACLAARTAMAIAHPELLESRVFYFETHYQLDAIAYGVVIACLCEFEKGRALLIKLMSPAAIGVAIILLAIGFGYRDPFFRETFRYSLQSISIAILIVSILFSVRLTAVQMLLNLSALDWIGRLSYSIYVWHYGARQLAGSSTQVWWQSFLLCLVLTIALSCASYYLVERPISDFRHRFRSVAPKHAVT